MDRVMDAAAGAGLTAVVERQSGAEARILEVTSYPPPRAGWGIRVEFLKKRLEMDGHRCVVLNIGLSRTTPSDEYETVMSGGDFLRKVWRFSRQGFVVHAHANGDSLKGVLLALTAELLNLACGHRCYLTFHAGVIQRYFPQHRNRWLVPLFWALFAIPRRIICNSDAVKACIVGYGVDARKIVPIAAFSRQYLEFTPADLRASLEAFLGRYPTVVFTYLRLRPLFFPTVLIEGMAQVIRRRADVGLVICGGKGHMDDGVWPEVEAAIRRHQLDERICFVDDLDHDAFLTVVQRSTLYLRTPITDGVASSVLEALALGVPVVACDNGTRPAGVITYPAEDPAALAAAVEHVIANRAAVVGTMTREEVGDTVSDEVALLTS
jgi:glycosyltransferase involved in cell wall biosynthesis